MPGFLVHVGAIINCLHPPYPPGQVTASPSKQPSVFVNQNQAVLTVNDKHQIVGCSFQVPAPTPSGTRPRPCNTIILEAAQRVFVNGAPAAILTPAAVSQGEGFSQGKPNSSPIQKRVVAI